MLRKLLLGLIFSTAATSAVIAAPVTLQVWALDEPVHFTENMAKEFEAKNPDIKLDIKLVNFANILNDTIRAVSTNTAPDLLMLDNPDIASVASHDVLLDLSDRIAASKVVDAKNFYPGPINQSTWKGKIYGFPRGGNTLGLYYNADLFKAAGLDPTKPPQTWDEISAAAAKLTDAQKRQYGFGFSAVATEESTFQFLPWAQSAGGDFNAINTDGSVRALEFWQKLVDDKVATPEVLVLNQPDLGSQFIAGNIAMIVTGCWELPRFASEVKFDWRVALMPIEKAGAPRASALGELAYAVPKTSAHPDEAFKFLEYIYSQSSRDWNEYGWLPLDQTATPKDPKWPEAYAVFAEQMKYARGRGPSPVWPKVSKAIQVAIQDALTHKTDAKTALDTAQSTIDGLIK